jgi:glycosyltransferase involved in cell wall biosynthesis
MNLTVVSVRLATPKKRLLLGPLSLHTHMRGIVNYGSAQRDRARDFGVPAEKLWLLHQPVDEGFWKPVHPSEPDVICAVGSEARDYETLLAAVEGLPLRLEIAVGSSVPTTMRRAGVGLIKNPKVAVHRQLDHRQLRDLYSRARLVVVPLRDVDYDAGVTVITEALAMAKPVVVTGTRGQVDVIHDGVEGAVVPPGDVRTLRAVLDRLMNDPPGCERMGAAGRTLVCKHHSLDRYLDSLCEIVGQGSGS